MNSENPNWQKPEEQSFNNAEGLKDLLSDSNSENVDEKNNENETAEELTEERKKELTDLQKSLESYLAILPDTEAGVLNGRIGQIYDKIVNSGNISEDELSDVIKLANSINQELQNIDLRKQYTDSISNLQNLLSEYVSDQEQAA